MSVALSSVPETIFAHCARLLQDLCATSSASGDVPGLYRMAERLGRELTSCGLESEISAEEGIDGCGQPVLVARGPGVGECGVLLLGHLDTVLRATVPEKSDDRLNGTGALDMKGGFVALIGALALLRSRDESLPEDLVVVAVPDEEIGGPISMRTVRQWGRDARVVFVLEPGAQTPGGETLVTGRRGLTVWRLDALGKAAHSGVAYWEGRSALAAAATWAGAAQKLSQSDDGPVVNVGRIVGGDSEFVSDVGEEHRFIGTSERLNIVADRCLVEGEARYLSLADRDRTLQRMRDMAAEISASWEVDFEFREVEYIPPMVASPASEVLARYLAGCAQQAGWELGLEPNRGGVSFPNFLPDPSAVCVLDGLGPVGGGMHTRSEYLDLQSLKRRIHLLAEALIYVRDQR